jgi:hypothetical protein
MPDVGFLPEGFSLRQLMLPFGMLMAVGTLVAMRLRRRMRRRVTGEMPALGERLGLSHRPGSAAATVGTLSGPYDGFDVCVDPDETAKLRVYFQTEPPIELRTYKHFKRAPAAMEELHTESEAFDGFFQDRFASPELADFLFDQSELNEWARAMQKTTIKLKSLVVNSEGIDCSIELKHPAVVSPAMVEQLLPLLTRLARVVESARKQALD